MENMAEGILGLIMIAAAAVASVVIVVLAVLSPWFIYKIHGNIEHMADDLKRIRAASERKDSGELTVGPMSKPAIYRTQKSGLPLLP